MKAAKVIPRPARDVEPGQRLLEPSGVVEQRIARADRLPKGRFLEHAQRISERDGRARLGRVAMGVRRARVADHSIDPA